MALIRLMGLGVGLAVTGAEVKSTLYNQGGSDKITCENFCCVSKSVSVHFSVEQLCLVPACKSVLLLDFRGYSVLRN